MFIGTEFENDWTELQDLSQVTFGIRGTCYSSRIEDCDPQKWYVCNPSNRRVLNTSVICGKNKMIFERQ